jgi:nucleotide-binding universal stress UspA family protein
VHRTDATVLIGYDGSEGAAAAVERAAELIGPGRAVVAHVWDSLAELLLHTDVHGLSGTMRAAAEELDEDDKREAAQIAERGADLAASVGFAAEPVSARGKPKAWPTLLELADLHDAAAIVVGSRGLGKVASALLGRVSSGVLDHARRPVLVVPPLEEEHPPGPLVIGYDGSEQARAAIEVAGPLFAVREVVVETVWISYAGISPAAVAGAPVAVVSKAAEELDREVEQDARRTAHEGARLAATQGFEVQTEIAQADAGVWRPLLDTAHAHRAAAVVVGSRGRSAMGATLLGSVSRALVHHAPAPVLVVRPPS